MFNNVNLPKPIVVNIENKCSGFASNEVRKRDDEDNKVKRALENAGHQSFGFTSEEVKKWDGKKEVQNLNPTINKSYEVQNLNPKPYDEDDHVCFPGLRNKPTDTCSERLSKIFLRCSIELAGRIIYIIALTEERMTRLKKNLCG